MEVCLNKASDHSRPKVICLSLFFFSTIFCLNFFFFFFYNFGRRNMSSESLENRLCIYSLHEVLPFWENPHSWNIQNVHMWSWRNLKSLWHVSQLDDVTLQWIISLSLEVIAWLHYQWFRSKRSCNRKVGLLFWNNLKRNLWRRENMTEKNKTKHLILAQTLKRFSSSIRTF